MECRNIFRAVRLSRRDFFWLHLARLGAAAIAFCARPPPSSSQWSPQCGRTVRSSACSAASGNAGFCLPNRHGGRTLQRPPRRRFRWSDVQAAPVGRGSDGKITGTQGGSTSPSSARGSPVTSTPARRQPRRGWASMPVSSLLVAFRAVPRPARTARSPRRGALPAASTPDPALGS